MVNRHFDWVELATHWASNKQTSHPIWMACLFIQLEW